MRNKLTILMLSFLLVGLLFSTVSATVVQWTWDDEGHYSTPPGYTEVASIEKTWYPPYMNLPHGDAYEWVIDDVNSFTAADDATLNVVFYDLFDWTVEDDSLTVYIKNGTSGADTGFFQYTETDNYWDGWTEIGTWSDPYGHGQWDSVPDSQRYDVVFSIDIDDVMSLVTDNGTFVIGIDPNCNYNTYKIAAELPIPEPATMLLLGSGLIGIASLGRKKIFKRK